MTERIFKYPFLIQDRFQIAFPIGAKIRHVDVQKGVPCLWAQVTPDNTPQVWNFRVFGTGHPIPDDEGLWHVATFQMGEFVWHLFMEGGG